MFVLHIGVYTYVYVYIYIYIHIHTYVDLREVQRLPLLPPALLERHGPHLGDSRDAV